MGGKRKANEISSSTKKTTFVLSEKTNKSKFCLQNVSMTIPSMKKKTIIFPKVLVDAEALMVKKCEPFNYILKNMKKKLAYRLNEKIVVNVNPLKIIEDNKNKKVQKDQYLEFATLGLSGCSNCVPTIGLFALENFRVGSSDDMKSLVYNWPIIVGDRSRGEGIQEVINQPNKTRKKIKLG